MTFYLSNLFAISKFQTSRFTLWIKAFSNFVRIRYKTLTIHWVYNFHSKTKDVKKLSTKKNGHHNHTDIKKMRNQCLVVRGKKKEKRKRLYLWSHVKLVTNITLHYSNTKRQSCLLEWMKYLRVRTSLWSWVSPAFMVWFLSKVSGLFLNGLFCLNTNQ